MEISIDKLCENLQTMISLLDKRTVKVEYFNGLKPSGYYVPQFVTTKMVLSGVADKIDTDWYAEIFVDGVCMFRSYYHSVDGNLELAEKRANDQLIRDIFNHGVMSIVKQSVTKL